MFNNLKEDDKIISNEEKVIEMITKHSKNVFNNPNAQKIREIQPRKMDIPFYKEEVKRAANKLRNNKSIESLLLKRSNHVVNIVEKILAGRTRPFFLDFFASISSSSFGGYVSVAEGNINLDNKRFSRFGLRMLNEHT
jgi:hypothetical protein